MSVPVDRRAWLNANGFPTGKRGRFSGAMWDAMDKAEQSGTRFIDPKSPTTVGTASVVTETGERVIRQAEVNPWAHHPDPIRSGTLSFVGPKGATLDVSAREACASCSYSFGWCYCDVPTFRYWKTGAIYKEAASVA